MTETWRYVDLGAVDAFENNAQMAVLSRSTAEAGEPTLQTSVWGRTHLNVGWFDDVDSTLDLAACERLGVQVIRRPFAGGGTTVRLVPRSGEGARLAAAGRPATPASPGSQG